MRYYSVRDALGRELWWTTERKTAVRLGRELNVAGVGAKLFTRVVGEPYAAPASVYQNSQIVNTAGLASHQLPVRVFRCIELAPPDDTGLDEFGRDSDGNRREYIEP